MSNYSSYKGISAKTLDTTNQVGTGSVILPAGTTAERPASTSEGQLRYNTTTGLYEQYTSVGWQAIDAPPTVSAISPTTFSGESGTTITITGTNFKSGAVVKFISNSGTEYSAATTTFVSSTSVTATTPQDFTVAQEPFDIKVINTSGLAGTLENALDCGATPTFTTASGSLGTIYDSQRSSYTLSTAAATDPDSGATISYSITSGALPTGMSLNSSTGAITGTANAVGSDTTSTFTVRATDNAGNTNDRSFSITVKAPVITTYTTVGSGTFSVPSGISSVWVVVVAGGGGSGSNNSGGGGAGGMIEHPSFPVTPGGTVSYTLGSGGAGQPVGASTSIASNGNDSVFGTLTAKGGGGSDYWTGFRTANSGGSGAGGSGNPSYLAAGGSGTQPSQAGASGTYGYGNPGGNGGNASGDVGGGGGGGAGGAGVAAGGQGSGIPYPGSGSPGGHGGLARATTIRGSTEYFAGGGGGGAGGSGTGPYWPGTVIGGVGGIGGPYTNPYSGSPLGGGGPGGAADRSAAGTAGGTNTGGGAGGGDNTNGANGGPGIVIVRY